MQNSAQKINTSEQKNNFPYFDLYSGGRHLNAVDFNTVLNMNQKHLLLVLGNQLDFRDVVKSKRYISVKSLAEKISCSQRTIHTITSQLNEMGYIEIEHRFENNKQKSNYYSITDKVFKEYYDKIGPANYAGGWVHGLQTEIPNKELPHIKTISKDIVTKPDVQILEPAIETPKIEKKPKKRPKTDLNKAIGYIGAMFKPDGSPETRGYPWPNKQQLEVVASSLIDKYGLDPIRLWFDAANEEGSLGKLRWMPSKFDSFIKRFVFESKK
jgi:DNA-binding MarR family transcriptional regulator